MPDVDLLAGAVWTEASHDQVPDGLYATHEGVFEFGGARLRCYRLNDGRAIFDAEDFEAFLMSGLGSAGEAA